MKDKSIEESIKHKIKWYNRTKEYGGYLIPVEILYLINIGCTYTDGFEVKYAKWYKKWYKEYIEKQKKKGLCNPEWFYFNIPKKIRPIFGIIEEG